MPQRMLPCFEKPRKKVTNEFVPDSLDEACEAPDNSAVHMLIIGLDYLETPVPLTCSLDANNMLDLAQACGIIDVNVMRNTQCTRDAVKAKIQEVGSRCQADEYFVLYFAGHGERVEDEDGDEDDGFDEAMVLVDEQGQFQIPETFLTDDVLATTITESISSDVRILIIMDCCHSGTIADLDKDVWEDYEAISITGCTDDQESQDMGKGGVFTHALLMGIDNLQKEDTDEYSVGMAFNMALKYDDDIFNSSQDLTIQMSSRATPENMAWPLVPQIMYTCPFKRVRQRRRALSATQPSLQELWHFGVPPRLSQLACDSRDLSLDVPVYKRKSDCSVQ
eukprot:TRINITY_DN10580_c0_g1_i1.p1 TRINITY_DN10580_c0_g1~~TRINITY_DN10580_c0_g1_i1.p1  ORF type:complete len:336 (-),score=55.49 TRINITY_DN10580_c0_g1_i1:179-1186(-)